MLMPPAKMQLMIKSVRTSTAFRILIQHLQELFSLAVCITSRTTFSSCFYRSLWHKDILVLYNGSYKVNLAKVLPFSWRKICVKKTATFVSCCNADYVVVTPYMSLSFMQIVCFKPNSTCNALSESCSFFFQVSWYLFIWN